MKRIGRFEITTGEYDGLSFDFFAPVSPQEAFWDEEEDCPQVSPGGFSTGLTARYSLKGWE